MKKPRVVLVTASPSTLPALEQWGLFHGLLIERCDERQDRRNFCDGDRLVCIDGSSLGPALLSYVNWLRSWSPIAIALVGDARDLDVATYVQRGVFCLLGAIESPELARSVRALIAQQDRDETLQDAARSAGLMSQLELVGRMSAEVSHEIRNQIAVVVQGVGLLQSSAVIKERPSDDSLQKALARMGLACDLAESSIRAFLDLAPPEQLHFERASLNRLVEQCVEGFSHSSLSRVEISYEMSADLPELMLDRVRMSRLLDHLIRNSMDAMPTGGKITIRTRFASRGEAPLGYVGENFGSKSRDIVLEVEDSGPGIHPELLPEIFNRAISTKPIGDGSGLGLLVCNVIAHHHGGQLVAGNQQESGLQIQLFLPGGPAGIDLTT